MGWSNTKKGPPGESSQITTDVYVHQIRSSQQDPVKEVLPVIADAAGAVKKKAASVYTYSCLHRLLVKCLGMTMCYMKANYE